MAIFMLITGSGKNHQRILKPEGEKPQEKQGIYREAKHYLHWYLLNTKPKSHFLV